MWICSGLLYGSAFIFGLAGTIVAILGVAVLITYSPKNGLARMDSLGDGYDEPELRAVLSGEKEHTPRKNKAQPEPEPPRVNLLVDIQAKLKAGKGAGYERWAKSFNLKQMAQTLNYLTEHGLLEYGKLAEKTTAATTRYNELSTKIKTAEKRLAEIAVLKNHIINYSKTREVYAAYRKARDEMKELLTVKANVDRLMGYEDQEKEQETQKKQDQSQGR